MKNTKYLFDEKQTPEGMVSVSQIQTFLACKKKWEYNYVEGIKPRVERSYLTIGKLCHKGMQVAMQVMWRNNGWNIALNCAIRAMRNEYESYKLETPMLNEELPAFEQLWIDAKSVFEQAFREFEPWKYEVLSVWKKGESLPTPALELHFRVPCPPTKGLHGYIDAILRDKETEFIWCTDYKFRKSLAPDEDEAFNIQNAVYSYACQRMGIEITGTMTWQHLNTPAADPQILKTGAISRAKIKTTWEHYAEFCEANGENPSFYEEEMKEKLADIEWCRPTLEYRNEETVKRIWDECVKPAARAIKAAHGKKAVNFRSLYPWNCKMCSYQSLCQAELRNYDADGVRSLEYVKRTPTEIPSVDSESPSNN